MPSAVTRPKAYLKVRHKTLREALKALQLDAILVTHRADIAYLTDFEGDESALLVTPGDFRLISDFRYKQQVAIQAGWLKMVVRQVGMPQAIAEAIAALKLRRVGFEANHLTVGQHKALEQAIRCSEQVKPAELVPVERVLANLRKVKDDHEIDLIRKSVAVAEEAYEAVRAAIKAGLTENYIAGLMVLELRARGASDASFPVVVASGANSVMPHHKPGESLIQADAPLLIDWGAIFAGYASDITRTLFIGRVSDRVRKAYKVVLEAQQAAIRFLRPGVTSAQADRVARGVIEDAGFGKEFGHSLGHGLGREVHELPDARLAGGEEELRPGMVLTVEPGIYLPGEGGVRVEDDVLITHSGCEVLSTLDRSLDSCQVG